MNTTLRGRRCTSDRGTLTAYPDPRYLVIFCLVAWLPGAEVVQTLTKLLPVGIWIWALESKDLVSSPALSLSESHSDTSIYLLSQSIQLSCVLTPEDLRTLCGRIDRWADFVGSPSGADKTDGAPIPLLQPVEYGQQLGIMWGDSEGKNSKQGREAVHTVHSLSANSGKEGNFTLCQPPQ